MHKSIKMTGNLLVAGVLMLGQALAQDTPPATTQTAPATAPPSSTAPKASSPAKSKVATSPATSSKTAAPKSASGAKPAAAPLALKTQKDKFSYSLGMKMGQSLHKQSVPVDPAVFSRGFRDGLSGGKTLLTDDEAQATMKEMQQQIGKQQQEKQQQLGSENKKIGEAFLASNKSKEGVVALPSGLQYKILKAGAGPKPAADDSVVCNYRGTLIDGKEFDSSYKQGQPVTFPVTGVIKGWTEALQLMPVGSKWQLFIPPDLAYGDRGAGADIGPNSTLIFEVELMSIPEKSKDKPAEKPADKP